MRERVTAVSPRLCCLHGGADRDRSSLSLLATGVISPYQ